jgi:hypothetical protein
MLVSHRNAGFPQAVNLQLTWMVAILKKSQGNECGFEHTQLAIESSLCYSQKVADEQWSLPVAEWPAP